MQLKIKNCNNIENGEFDITEGRLNIKLRLMEQENQQYQKQ